MKTNSNNIVKKFTSKECFNILKELIVHGKASKDTYTLILLWLTGVFSYRQYAYLRTLSGGNIIARDINSNTDELIELTHEIILELITHKINRQGKKIGLRYKVSWDEIPITNKVTGEVQMLPIEGNEGRVVSFIYAAFKNILFKSLGKSYRGSVDYSSLYAIRKSKIMEDFHSAIKEETDTGIVTPEVIQNTINNHYFEGVHKSSGQSKFDILLYQYRYIYSLGYQKNFLELTEEIAQVGAVKQELDSLTSADIYRKILYEEIMSALNSEVMPKLNREFLKCFYGIPCFISIENISKSFIPDMVLFFDMYPEYKQVLKVKRISYSGKRRKVKWIDDNSIVDKSKLYSNSHEMLRKLISPRLEELQSQYSEDLSKAKDMVLSYDQPLGLGSDLYFSEMTSIGEN